MNDSIAYQANKKVLHYGSLEEREKSRSGSPAPPSNSANINKGSGETMAIEESQSSKTRDELIKEFERKKRGRHVVVSTDDAEVKRNLRQVTHFFLPACLPSFVPSFCCCFPFTASNRPHPTENFVKTC